MNRNRTTVAISLYGGGVSATTAFYLGERYVLTSFALLFTLASLMWVSALTTAVERANASLQIRNNFLNTQRSRGWTQ